jgi:hypothetical protein
LFAYRSLSLCLLTSLGSAYTSPLQYITIIISMVINILLVFNYLDSACWLYPETEYFWKTTYPPRYYKL